MGLRKAGLGDSVHKLVTLGTPHEGVPLAAAKLLVNYMANKLHLDAQTAVGGVEDLVAPVGILVRNDFLTSLNAGDSPYKRTADYYTLAGTAYQTYLDGWGIVINDDAYRNSEGTIVQDGIVPQYSALSSALSQKSDARASGAITHTATVALNHAELNGDENDARQQVMVAAVKPFILASLTGTVK